MHNWIVHNYSWVTAVELGVRLPPRSLKTHQEIGEFFCL